MRTNNITFCKKCLYSSLHPLGITFNDEGICSGCQIHEEKYNLDWKFRWNKLKKIVKQYKSKKNNYDCIVPVTGSQDSYFTVYIVKKLGLNPLLVNYNKYFNTSVGIENLSNLRIKFNCDIIFKNVNINSVKKITKNTFVKFGNIYWPILAGHSVFPVEASIKFKIPLIIWGAHQGIEQVGMFSHKNEVEMSRRYRRDHDLFNFEAENLSSVSDNLVEDDLVDYYYPSDDLINKIGTRGIYLGNFIPWDPKNQHEMMIKKFNYKTYKFNRTLDCYDYVDCFNYMNLHDYLKYLKHGYSKVTDHLSREIRHGRIDKPNALRIAIDFEKKPIKHLKLFLDWLGIKEDSFKFLVSKHNRRFQSLNKIHLRKLKEMRYSPKKIKFISNSTNSSKNYIIFGKGFY